MRYFENRIIAKSEMENWLLEKSGDKNNTVREVTGMEHEKIIKIRDNLMSRRQKLVLENVKTGESFERIITDISFFETYKGVEKTLVHVYIISFKHKEDDLGTCGGDDKKRDDRADSDEYVFGLDMGIPGEDKSSLVVARRHQNGTIEIVDSKTF